MNKIALSATLALGAAVAFPSHADTLALWNFNDSNLVVDVGAGTASLFGGTTTSGFNSGSPADGGSPNSGWSTSTYAAQGTGDKSRGVQFTVSTLGFEDVVFTYDGRHSGTASGYELVQYSLDGATFFDAAVFQYTDTNFKVGNTIDLSEVVGADNNSNLTFRILATFAPGTSSYASSGGASYGTSGTMRFDLVTISGTAIAPVPEPASGAMLLAGLAVVGLLARRRRR